MATVNIVIKYKYTAAIKSDSLKSLPGGDLITSIIKNQNLEY